jgi:hypothetical protein
LDVSLFSPLAKYYDKQLSIFQMKNQGWTRFTKRNFFALFWKAWEDAMIPKNVASGWAKTGLYPFNLAVVLDQLKKTANKEVPELEETLFSPEDHMAAILAANPSRDDRHFV